MTKLIVKFTRIEFGKNSHKTARLRAQQANISQQSQKSDNQSAKVNQRLEAHHREDTEDKQRLQAEIAQLQSHNQYDITNTDMTLRPCAKGELRSAVGESAPLDAPPLPPQISDGGVEGEGGERERKRNIRQGIDNSQENQEEQLRTSNQEELTE